MESDKRLPSGEWDGFYLESQHSRRGWMHLFLQFEKGGMKGEGTDYVGPWTASGRYDAEAGTAQWVKHYVNKHQVEYQGQITDKGIMGEWRIGWVTGPFHVWPRGMSEFNELYLQNEMNVPFEAPVPFDSPLETVEESEIPVV